MKIAVRSGKDGVWKRIPGNTNYEGKDVKDLIYQIPELVSSDDIKPGTPDLKACVWISSSNSLEDGNGLIGLDADGRISIIECRMHQEPSIRRAIMGQVLEYAAILWEMTYDEFNRKVAEREGKSLEDLMKERVPEDAWAAEKFKENISSGLNHGDFRLIIAVNGLTDELKRTIRFLNARGPFSFDIYALEMQYFSNGETEILIPRLFSFSEFEQVKSPDVKVAPKRTAIEETDFAIPKSSTEKSEPIIADSKQTSKAMEKSIPLDQKESLFFTKCLENIKIDTVDLIKKLYEFSKSTADDIIWWGSNGAGAFNFVLTEDALTVFIVDANGRIMFNFSEWQREPSYKDLLPQFLERLKGITVLRKQREDYTRWPDFSIEEFFAKPEDFKIFEESIKFLKDELNKMAFI